MGSPPWEGSSVLPSIQSMETPPLKNKHNFPAKQLISRVPGKSDVFSATGTTSEVISASMEISRHKDILAATRAGDLESVQKYCLEGQTEMTDVMGEVNAVLTVCVNQRRLHF